MQEVYLILDVKIAWQGDKTSQSIVHKGFEAPQLQTDTSLSAKKLTK